jgi:2-oxoglutarate ferredoxin oxidoreductase subunit gamma
MKEEILIAGYGGQGVVVAGSLLANAAVYESLETCGMVAYGAEMRGGTANSTLIISDQKIGSPVVIYPDTAIILNQDSLEKYENDIKPNGLLLLNISECEKRPKRKDLQIYYIKATEIASGLGEKRAANFVMVGAYLKRRNLLKIDSVVGMVSKVLPKANSALLEVNKLAIKRGYENVH